MHILLINELAKLNYIIESKFKHSKIVDTILDMEI